MKYLIALIIQIMPSMSNAKDDVFIIGAWLSDKEKTILYNQEVIDLTETQKILLNDILGKYIITFTKKEISWVYDDTSGKSSYKIIDINDKFIEITESNEAKSSKYFKDGNWMYINANDTSILKREYFKRVE